MEEGTRELNPEKNEKEVGNIAAGAGPLESIPAITRMEKGSAPQKLEQPPKPNPEQKINKNGKVQASGQPIDQPLSHLVPSQHKTMMAPQLEQGR